MVFSPESERRKQVEYLRKFCALLLVDGWDDFDSAVEAANVSLVAIIEPPERAQQEFAQAGDHYNEMWGYWVRWAISTSPRMSVEERAERSELFDYVVGQLGVFFRTTRRFNADLLPNMDT